MTRYTILYMLATLLMAFGAKADARQTFEVSNITTANGLPCNTIRVMAEDEFGYVWVGGTGGLARYDGYRFVDFNGFGPYAQSRIPQHIGLSYTDKQNHLLWFTTSINTYGCYDLRRGAFVDYTGIGDNNREFRKRKMLSTGMWLYNTTFGIRHVIYRDGQFSVQDYTKENGQIATNDVRMIEEAGDKQVWAATKAGLFRIDTAGKAHTVLKGKDMTNVLDVNQYMVGFCKQDQTAYIFNQQGKLLRAVPLPKSEGRIDEVIGPMVWRTNCFFYTKGDTYTLDVAGALQGKSGTFINNKRYRMESATQQGYADGYHFVANKSGYLWIFPPKGEARKLFVLPNLQSNNEKNGIYKVARDKSGLFYISTYGGGLFTYDFARDHLVHYSARDENPLIPTDFLLGVMIDRTGCVWLSCESSGITRLQPANDIVASYFLMDPTHRGDWTNNARYLYLEKRQTPIVCSKSKELFHFNAASHSFVRERQLTSCIYGYLYDSKGNEWMATRGDGLLCNGQRVNITVDGKPCKAADFYAIVEDRYGRIWAGSWANGLICIDRKEQQALAKSPTAAIAAHAYLTETYNESHIHALALDEKGVLWIATYNGLYCTDTKKRQIAPKDFCVFNLENGLFPMNDLLSLHAYKGKLYGGTRNGGLIVCDINQWSKQKLPYRQLTKRDGLSNNTVCSITHDQYGHIWVGTEYGLCKLEPKTLRIRSYSTSVQPIGNEFAENSVLNLPDGRIAFGSANGIAVFRPLERDYEHKQTAKVLITDLLINGTSIYDDDELLPEAALNGLEKLSFSHNENSLRLFFSNFNYRETPSQLYEYYLEGQDRTWRKATSENSAEYTNLAPGKYVFHIRTATISGEEQAETTLTIVIRQPWYNTIWAWLVYLLIAGSVGYYIYRNAREKILLHQQMKKEEEQAEFRINFFTHISHEFRTPLAIIQNAVDKMANPKTSTQANVRTAQRGTRRLLRLINQLMEFRKINTGNLKLKVEPGDIVVFVDNIFQDLWGVAKQKDINYRFMPFQPHYKMTFDREMVEMMVYNLLSNAVKYTPERGSILLKMTLDETAGQLVITVEDSGRGISDEQQKELFKPFMKGHVSKNGMGIGLYTAFQMAQRHHGSLAYERVGAEGGSRFTLTLPTSEDDYQADDFSMEPSVPVEAANEQQQELIREPKPAAINPHLVAIIEDDADMMEQIKAEVGAYFETCEFYNGRLGYEGVLERQPDLVLCDVMLPDMDGYEIVSRLKENADTRLTPVIMLTALNDDTHQIKAYKAGADDYMVKPCNFQLLVARIMQLLKWRSARPESPSSETMEKEETEAPILSSRADLLFKESVAQIVAQNMSKEDFSVDTLAELMHMGRTKFYGKMKEIYGMSPNKYLVNQRMEYAAQLLLEGKYNISEITYKVGIGNPSYFNKCFKSHFGVAPSKYKG